MLKVQLQEDKTPQQLSPELMECLADEPQALAFLIPWPNLTRAISVNGLKAQKQKPPKPNA